MRQRKPQIILEFADDTCNWMSVGWGDDPRLMALAKDAINAGETPDEVVDLLEPVFEVTVGTSFPTEG